MKPKEFDEIFKVKATEFAQTLGAVSETKGYIIHGVDIAKAFNYVYTFTMLVTKKGFRMLPMRVVKTVMYDPITDAYLWHDGYPDEKEEKVLN